MFTINLISPSYKKIQKTKRILINVKFFFLSLTFFVLISATVLLIAEKLVTENHAMMLEKAAKISQNQKGDKKIKNINKKIKLAQIVQKDYIPWSRFIIALNNYIPEGITVQSLNITPTKNNDAWDVEIVGIASDRDSFLLFKDTLMQRKNILDNIEIPLTNVFKKNDINFNATFVIKKETLVNLNFQINK